MAVVYGIMTEHAHLKRTCIGFGCMVVMMVCTLYNRYIIWMPKNDSIAFCTIDFRKIEIKLQKLKNLLYKIQQILSSDRFNHDLLYKVQQNVSSSYTCYGRSHERLSLLTSLPPHKSGSARPDPDNVTLLYSCFRLPAAASRPPSRACY